MTVKSHSGFWVLGTGLLLALAIAGCQPLPPKTPKASTESSSKATVPTTIGTAQVSDAAPPSAQTETAPTLTPVTVAVVNDEEDCMAGCHLPDPNEHIADGAVAQPASHAGRSTCLSCHAAAVAPVPALPATHLGRLDPSCAVCHKPQQ